MANKPMTTKQALDLLQKHAAFTPKQSDMLELDAVLTHFRQMAADLEREQGVREDAQRQLRVLQLQGNQCDGCRQGNIAYARGLHRNEDGRAFMACQKDRYRGR